MIHPLNLKDIALAKEIQKVFMASYAIEAELLNAKNFPPLKRTLEEYVIADADFYGYFEGTELAAVSEVKMNQNNVHIQSLVVHPNHFRKGIAGKLIEYVFQHYNASVFMVETGVDNGPATSLYKKHGFHEIHQWDTNHGVRKVRFEKS